MRNTLVLAALLATASCGVGPTEQEENLSERGSAPEQIANSGSGNIASGTAPATEQGELGDTMPDEPGGPSGDRGSGTGGDTVPSQ